MSVDKSPWPSPMLRRVLLSCGIVSTLLYLSTDIIAGTMWKGYSFTNQAVSELSAVGAPTREFVVPLYFLYSVLMIAFGLGVWGYSRKRFLRITAGLMVGIGLLGFVGYPFPLRLGVAEAEFTNTIHTIIASVTGRSYMAAMGFGAFAYGRRFRLYSIGTLLVLIVVGALAAFMAGTDITQRGFTAPPPWFGLIERIDIYSSMIWVAVLASVLLRVERLDMQTSSTKRVDNSSGGPEETHSSKSPIYLIN
ncbi:MAG: DUF998 domain-containing protein [Candidatus Bathyarchaeia archaeon]